MSQPQPQLPSLARAARARVRLGVFCFLLCSLLEARRGEAMRVEHRCSLCSAERVQFGLFIITSYLIKSYMHTVRSSQHVQHKCSYALCIAQASSALEVSERRRIATLQLCLTRYAAHLASIVPESSGVCFAHVHSDSDSTAFVIFRSQLQSSPVQSNPVQSNSIQFNSSPVWCPFQSNTDQTTSHNRLRLGACRKIFLCCAVQSIRFIQIRSPRARNAIADCSARVDDRCLRG